MAHTAHTDPEQVIERYDSESVLNKKVDLLVEFIMNSQHFVTFTGAGISTSAGIPDFRGPQGVWTLKAQGKQAKAKVSTISAYPTPTHMSLVQLQRNNILKYLISQNCDGLHRRSTFPASHISELHGNSNMEVCETCGQNYFRDMACHRMNRQRDHWTGRFCGRENCKGRLLEYTIDFGQNLPETPLRKANENSKKSDLHLVLGSSLTVSPACDCPHSTKQKGGKLVIVNLQNTPLTDIADIHIFAKTDTVMEMVMERLTLDIPQFELKRKCIIGAQENEQNKMALYCRGADIEDSTLTMDIFHNVKYLPCIEHEGNIEEISTDEVLERLSENRGQFVQTCNIPETFPENLRIEFPLKLEFKGHYCEPDLLLKFDFTPAFITKQRCEFEVDLIYNPYERTWNFSQICSNLTENSYAAHNSTAHDNSYGQSHREYVVDGIVQSSKISKEEAQEVFDKYVESTHDPKNWVVQTEKKNQRGDSTLTMN